MQIPPNLVKRSLSAHSMLGITVGILMYVICLTGTLAAVAETFERWEQPDIEEFHNVRPASINTAIKQFIETIEGNPTSLWLVFPTPEIPRMHVTGDEQERFTRSDGSLDDAPVENWTHMLRELHVRLHLPQTIGLIIVSAVGAMLFALIISGLLAHPRLFKDAFSFRLGGSRRLAQADIHNRLSVWVLPFHAMISITGAFYGLVGILVILASAAWYDGDKQALFDVVYGADPVLEGQALQANPNEAMQQLKERHPNVRPIYLVIHNRASDNQFIEIAATVPRRLAYSEIYRFDALGNYLGSQELTTGPLGRQVLYSLYRIHFGYFGGQWTRVIWLLLGLALTIVSVSGINIWLAKRNLNDVIDRLWVGVVWGTPLALVISAATSVFTAMPALPIFVTTLGLAVAYLGATSEKTAGGARLQFITAIAMAGLACGHLIKFIPTEFGNYLLIVNGCFLFCSIILGAKVYAQKILNRSDPL